MATTSSMQLYRQLRTWLLSFAPASGGDTLDTRLDGRLYWRKVPDDATTPYGVLRFVNRSSGFGGNAERETIDLELILYTRSDAEQEAVEDAADVADQAMRNYRDSSSGLVFSRQRQRDTVPQLPDAVDAEQAAVRCVYPLVVWPEYLLDYVDL